nr:MAG TPA: hypothetical protein [Caudoviricetes sp.]
MLPCSFIFCRVSFENPLNPFDKACKLFYPS